MPINGMSGEFRPPRYAKVRLGYKPKGKTYPRDVDVFVGRIEDGVTKDILDAYRATRIEDAEGETWNLGKSLRMLTYFEWDAMHPKKNTELVVGLMNRAWTHSKLRCSGTGGDEPGEAFCRDEAFKTEIVKATKHKAVEVKGGWKVICLGPECPMWHSHLEQNKAATCHHEMRFLAQLLHPTANPEDPNYLKNFGSVEVVSGSFNGAIDVQSGLQLLRSVAGRSANVPFSLMRKPRTMLVDGKRVVKATLMVGFDNDEAIRFGYSDPRLSLVRPEVRKQLMAQRREQLALAQMEVDHDSVKDIVPRLEAPRSSESGRTDYPDAGSATGSGSSVAPSGSSPGAAVPGDTVPDSSTSVVGDRDQVIDDASGAASETDLNRLLTQDERNELKVLCGGVAGEPETQGHFRELVTLALKDGGDWDPKWDASRPPLTLLRIRHQVWIREAIEAEKGEA